MVNESPTILGGPFNSVRIQYKKNPLAMVFLTAAAAVIVLGIIATITIATTFEAKPSEEVSKRIQELQDKIALHEKKSKDRRARQNQLDLQRKKDLELQQATLNSQSPSPVTSPVTPTDTTTSTTVNVPPKTPEKIPDETPETEEARQLREKQEAEAEEERQKIEKKNQNPEIVISVEPLDDAVYISGAMSKMDSYNLKTVDGKLITFLELVNSYKNYDDLKNNLKNAVKLGTDSSGANPILLVTTEASSNRNLPKDLPKISFPWYQMPEGSIEFKCSKNLIYGDLPSKTIDPLRFLFFSYPLKDFSQTHKIFSAMHNKDMLKDLSPEEILRIGREFIFALKKFSQLKPLHIPLDDLIVLYELGKPCIFMGPLVDLVDRDKAFSDTVVGFFKLLLENSTNLTTTIKKALEDQKANATNYLELDRFRKDPIHNNLLAEFEPNLIAYIHPPNGTAEGAAIKFINSKVHDVIYLPNEKFKPFGGTNLKIKKKTDQKHSLTVNIEFETLDGLAPSDQLKNHQEGILTFIWKSNLKDEPPTRTTTCKTTLMPISSRKILSQKFKLYGDREMIQNVATITADITHDQVAYEVHDILDTVPLGEVKIILQSIFAKVNWLISKKVCPTSSLWAWRLYVPNTLDNTLDLQLLLPLITGKVDATQMQSWKSWMNDFMNTLCKHHLTYLQTVRAKLEEAFDKAYDPTAPELNSLFN